ncbi:RNA polymerase sigma factor [Methylomonas fluvii]|uniref:RNA polymerase sigma factor n=1 Tax=Methylomonas fluvii TaxID=1854564 RepID=A0ABR9DF76_9GAMM|nr:RNA polymerase sigma factor [Methylomonas fluvii]MBD9360562.1 RNA polymerase sigma factor [Methylomonas fluvii]
MNKHYPPLTTAYLRHQTELKQFLWRQVDCREAAADLLQDTFLHIADYPEQDTIANCRAFLYRVAGNLALDYLRSQARQQAWDGGPLDEGWQCPCPPPERLVQGKQPSRVSTANLYLSFDSSETIEWYAVHTLASNPIDFRPWPRTIRH